jgi:hypothetical protein
VGVCACQLGADRSWLPSPGDRIMVTSGLRQRTVGLGRREKRYGRGPVGPRGRCAVPPVCAENLGAAASGSGVV